jgi:spermidine/putrescine transport system substrate-binding protein
MKRLFVIIPALLLTIIFSACTPEPTLPAGPTPGPELIFLDWAEDMPQSVLDQFEAEYGVTVKYLTYDATEEAAERIKIGDQLDVVVLDNDNIDALIRAGMLHPIDPTAIPNIKNISPNFRGLAFDPTNTYSVPFNWGTTGIIYHTKRVDPPIRTWADLWNPELQGRVGLWLYEGRETIGFTLKSLGYSANSENPAELEAARQRLMELRPNVQFIENMSSGVTGVYLINEYQLDVAMGYAYDALEGEAVNPDIQYILPEDGVVLWSDSFVVPASSPNPVGAELFLNFILRPEIAAEIANHNYYATPNEAALSLLDPDLRNNPIVFPPAESLTNAEILMPISPEAEALYNEIWAEFVNAAP